MRFSRILAGVFVVGLALFVGPTQVAHGATLAVDSTADTTDFSTADGVCDTNDSVGNGPCTLRAAIEQANGLAGLDRIEFSIAGAGPHTISPSSALPTITDPLIIDGTSEPDFVNTPIVELDGTSAGTGPVNGLNITAGGSTVKGLVINRFGQDGIELIGNGGNTIEGNYIGADTTGTSDLGNGRYGVLASSNAPDNTIGGTTASARNVVSGNDSVGVMIKSMGNVVEGNYIGTDVAGSTAVGNFSAGVYIDGAAGNTIGGTASGARNVISGNNSAGVFIANSASTANTVEGNYIGVSAAGTAALGNSTSGVFITGAPGNTIGGTASGAGNVISANGWYGVRIENTRASGNTIEGNYIGTDAAGSAGLGNSRDGVSISSAPATTIGGAEPGARNVISGNDWHGIYLYGGSGTAVQGNYIGTDVTGTADLGNSSGGVYISDAPDNIIGGTAAGAGNVISGNDVDGVSISSAGSTGNRVEGNYIGTDVTGSADLGNSRSGVYTFFDATGNTIGGTASGARNVISGNDTYGVVLFGYWGPVSWNVVEGNYVGTDATGSADLGNSSGGVLIATGAANNTIGGPAAGAGNVISGNDGRGVFIFQDAAGNQVQGNYIGTQADGTSPLGNASHGVQVALNALDNVIGLDSAGAGAGNTIANNSGDGVQIDGCIDWLLGECQEPAVDAASATGNTIRGNSIYSNAGLGIGNIRGGNMELTPPTVTATGPASGTSTCLGCKVDVYSDNADQGEIYHGSTTTDSGTGAWSFAPAVAGPNVTATVTDASGNTSQFSGQVACTDTDLDTVCDSGDNCPDDANASQLNSDGDALGDACDQCPAFATFGLWPVPVGDSDCDGFTDADEANIGTDPDSPCGASAWPPDFDSNTAINTTDVFQVLPPTFGSSVPPVSPRRDLHPSGVINTTDVFPVLPPFLGSSCTP
jgi:titin